MISFRRPNTRFGQSLNSRPSSDYYVPINLNESPSESSNPHKKNFIKKPIHISAQSPIQSSQLSHIYSYDSQSTKNYPITSSSDPNSLTQKFLEINSKDKISLLKILENLSLNFILTVSKLILVHNKLEKPENCNSRREAPGVVEQWHSQIKNCLYKKNQELGAAIGEIKYKVTQKKGNNRLFRDLDEITKLRNRSLGEESELSKRFKRDSEQIFYILDSSPQTMGSFTEEDYSTQYEYQKGAEPKKKSKKNRKRTPKHKKPKKQKSLYKNSSSKFFDLIDDSNFEKDSNNSFNLLNEDTNILNTPSFDQSLEFQRSHRSKTKNPHKRKKNPIIKKLSYDIKASSLSNSIGFRQLETSNSNHHQTPRTPKTPPPKLPKPMPTPSSNRKDSISRVPFRESLDHSFSEPPNWHTYTQTKIPIEPSLDRLDTCRGTRQVFLTGPKRSFRFIESEGLLKIAPNKLSAYIKGEQIKSSEEFVLVIEPLTNDCVFYNNRFEEQKRIAGFPNKSIFYLILDPAFLKETFHHYRHSLDNYFMLWKSGQNSLSVIDLETRERRELISQFWTFQGRPSMPISAAADRTAERIIASSQADLDLYLIHYYEDSKLQKSSFCAPISSVLPFCKVFLTLVVRANDLEISFDEQNVLICGIHSRGVFKGKAMVAACSFDENLTKLAEITLKDGSYGKPNRIRRIRGSEALLVALDRFVVILEYKNETFYHLGIVSSGHETQISDLVMFGDRVLSKGEGEDFLLVTKFKKDFSIEKSKDANFGEIGVGSSKLVQGVGHENKGESSNNSRSRSKSGKSRGDEKKVWITNFKNFNIEKIKTEYLDNLQKVMVSMNGTKLYVGGRGLHIFEKRDSSFKVKDLDINHGKFYFLYKINHFLV